MNVPIWLKPSKKQIADAKVVLKAFVKGVIIAGSGALSMKFGANIEVSGAIAGFTHALIKIIDPSDKSIGYKKQ